MMNILAPQKVPKYEEVASLLREQIESGKICAGDRIAPEPELSATYGVSRNTIRQAVSLLENESFLIKKRGVGTFVGSNEKSKSVAQDQKQVTQYKSAKQEKTKTIGVFIEEPQLIYHPVLGRVLAGIQSVTRKAGYHLNVIAVNNEQGVETTDWTKLMDLQKVQGVIVMAQFVPFDKVEALAKSVPVIWTHHRSYRPGFDGVKLDYSGGMFDAAQHIKNLGHKNIAILTVSEQHSVGSAQRYGVRLGLREGLLSGEISLQEIVCDNFEVILGYKKVIHLLESENRPTAILCGSDELAVGAFKAIHETGLSVPEDISIVGCNDIYVEYTEDVSIPPLTTIHIDYRKVGESSAMQLLDCINDKQKIHEAPIVPSRLIIRESTTKVPKVIRTINASQTKSNSHSNQYQDRVYKFLSNEIDKDKTDQSVEIPALAESGTTADNRHSHESGNPVNREHEAVLI